MFKTRIKRQIRTRGKINKNKSLLRVTVFRSNKYIQAQIIDDVKNVTLLSVSDKNLGKEKMTKIEKAHALGLLMARDAAKKKIKKIVFDRGRYAYHGRVKAIAEGLREGGLEF